MYTIFSKIMPIYISAVTVMHSDIYGIHSFMQCLCKVNVLQIHLLLIVCVMMVIAMVIKG